MDIEELRKQAEEVRRLRYQDCDLVVGKDTAGQFWCRLSRGDVSVERPVIPGAVASTINKLMFEIDEIEQKKRRSENAGKVGALAAMTGIPSVSPIVVEPGLYQHKKGGMYRVLMMVRDATNAADRDWMVMYVSMTFGENFVRKASEFVEPVEWPDGETRPRFVSLGPARMAPGKAGA